MRKTLQDEINYRHIRRRLFYPVESIGIGRYMNKMREDKYQNMWGKVQNLQMEAHESIPENVS